MKGDITNRADIELLVETFYTLVLGDDTIGLYFSYVVNLSWEKHILGMSNFWEAVLLDNIVLSNAIITHHTALDKIAAFHPQHYNRWLLLWTSTVYQLHRGPVATKAIAYAKAMECLVNKKTSPSLEDGFIQ